MVAVGTTGVLVKGTGAGAVAVAPMLEVAMLTFVVGAAATTVGSLILFSVLRLSSVNSLAAKLGVWITLLVVTGTATLVAVNVVKIVGLRDV